jgi:hypothetical protein
MRTPPGEALGLHHHQAFLLAGPPSKKNVFLERPRGQFAAERPSAWGSGGRARCVQLQQAATQPRRRSGAERCPLVGFALWALLSSWPGRRRPQGTRAPLRKQTSSPMSSPPWHVPRWQTPPLSTPLQEPFGTARDGDGDWRGLAVPSTRPSTWVSSLGLGLRLRVVQDYGGQY